MSYPPLTYFLHISSYSCKRFTILGSGAIGAFIYAAISLYRNKKQAIASRVDVFPTFEGTFGASGLRNHITISDGQKEYQYEELQTV